MRTINADAIREPDPLLEARRPLELVVEGHRYRARPLSFEAVLKYEAECIGASPARREAALSWLLRLAFGYRVSYWWRGDPVRRILRHPNRAKVIADFFRSLIGRTGAADRSSSKATRGTP